MTQLSLPVEDLVSFHNLPEKARDKKKKLKSEPKPEGKAKKKDKGKAAVQDGETQRQRGKENNMPVAEEREIKSDKRKEKKKKDSKKKKEKNSSEHYEIQQQDPQTSSVIVKLEPDEDGDFAPAKKQSKGKKRARQGEAGELSKSKKVKLEEDADGVETETKPQKKKKIKKEEGNKKPKKEEGAIKAKKKTQEEKEAAAALKLKKKEEEEQMRWRWWEEEKYEDGIKWKFLEHEGPVFAPPYEPLPDSVKFYYDGKPLPLSLQAEEVASFFAKMLDHEYTTKEIFRNNYFMDWRKEMTLEERMVITDLAKCDFTEMFTYYKGKMEEKKNKSKEDKLKIKEENEKLLQEYGYCSMDHHRERIGNFKIEPPALFRGRGDHPKQGMLKKRILPEDIIINCSKDSKIPEPPPGHKWKEVRHDNTVTWLASWTENVQGSVKYIMLNANSKLKLALRAGNEKEEGETADTVGCCSLRVEHIKLYPELDGDKYVVEFDFLGKDSIRYYNKVPVEKQVFKNLQLFMENKQEGDDLFDRLSTPLLNKHLQSLMEGLTAKVFRTYNASITLQQQLQELTDPEESMPSKILSYNRANRAVAILCNHQRAPPKTFDQSMANLKSKIDAKKEQILLAKKELKEAKKEAKEKESEKLNKVVESKKRGVQRAEEQLMRMEVQATDREENKQIALSTSKLNYLDPRISVAWCKKWTVGLEKIYNKTYRDKFAWAVDMTETDFIF
ncbi:topoisomerase (DNA) I, gene 2 isoform X3 [Xenopus tropicalis]|uniref:DNA topoisomerase I n=1 Tax=Xenopus tropicalis TaxID=8364 RepID=A0A6I8QI98_XENTR|nr:topoisomerase (DNA) I, gene 2 isoform X3 [Xenopus tropicalis]